MDLGTIGGFIGGVVVTLAGVWKYIRARITKDELEQIVQKIHEAYEAYEEAKADDQITKEEALEILHKSLAAIDEVVKSLMD